MPIGNTPNPLQVLPVPVASTLGFQIYKAHVPTWKDVFGPVGESGGGTKANDAIHGTPAWD